MVDAFHHVRITRFTDTDDLAVEHTNVSLIDAGPIDYERVGDDEIEGLMRSSVGRLTHALAQGLPAAKFALVAVSRLSVVRETESQCLDSDFA